MTRHSIKKSDLRTEYDGIGHWLRETLDIPDEVDITFRDGGMYGNMYVVFTDEGGEEIEASAYFSSGLVPYRHVTINSNHRAWFEERRA